MIFLARVIYREDNLQQNKHEEINNYMLMDSLSRLARQIHQLQKYWSKGAVNLTLHGTRGRCQSHLHIRVKGGLSHTGPVLSSVEMHFVHARYKQFFCKESWATSIIISGPVEISYSVEKLRVKV